MRRALAALVAGIAIGIALNPLTGKPATPGVAKAIRKVWGKDAPVAERVAWCESRWYVWARNGSHIGVFQMGAPERARFQRGTGYWAQIRAARRYFLYEKRRGYDPLSPWYASRSCWS